MINQCQKLVTADRASLFLVDRKTNQLYARLFNISYEGQQGDMADINQEFVRCPAAPSHTLACASC